jgi:hypothetical protein
MLGNTPVDESDQFGKRIGGLVQRRLCNPSLIAAVDEKISKNSENFCETDRDCRA